MILLIHEMNTNSSLNLNYLKKSSAACSAFIINKDARMMLEVWQDLKYIQHIEYYLHFFL
jgi:hypothetical protein